MFVIIDVVIGGQMTFGEFPTPQSNTIESINLIITDLNGKQERKTVTKSELTSIKGIIESNVVLSYCYEFEKSFLEKYDIHPQKYIDINHLIGMGSLKFCCGIYNIYFDQSDICRVLYDLCMINRNRIFRYLISLGKKRRNEGQKQHPFKRPHFRTTPEETVVSTLDFTSLYPSIHPRIRHRVGNSMY